jgi:hypothetical protein
MTDSLIQVMIENQESIMSKIDTSFFLIVFLTGFFFLFTNIISIILYKSKR